MKNILKFKSMFAIVILAYLMSCTPNENSKRISEITNLELVSIIKQNFLATYGGVEREGLYMCELFAKHSGNCGLDTILIDQLVDKDYEVNLKAQLKIRCSESQSVYNNLFTNYSVNGSLGKVLNGEVSQNFQYQSAFNIAGNVNDNRYVTSASGYRNITFTSPAFKNIKANFRFITNLCTYDVQSCTISDKTDFDISFRLYDNENGGESITVKGVIKLENEKWIFIDENGQNFELN